MRTRARSNEGTAMILVVAILMIMMIGSSAFLYYFNRTQDRSRNSERHQMCLNLAEGGIDKAAAQLAAGSIPPGKQEMALDDGEISIETQPAPETGEYLVTSTALMRGGSIVQTKARVEARLLVSGGKVRTLEWQEVMKW